MNNIYIKTVIELLYLRFLEGNLDFFNQTEFSHFYSFLQIYFHFSICKVLFESNRHHKCIQQD